MYDLSGTDTGREWVEVYNNGTSSVDLSTYKFTEATTNHTLRSISGNPIIGPGEYAILADDSTKFLIDWPSFNGNLFDSTFSLSNSGATLTLKDSSAAVIDQITYTSSQGANGDGNTLQKTATGWVAALPTPGLINATTGAGPVSTSTAGTASTTANAQVQSSTPIIITTTTISTHYSYIPLSDYTATKIYNISAGRDRQSIAGSPLEFKADANIEDKNAIYTWNFGDGSKGEGKLVEHTYEYPGDYVVVVNGLHENDKSISRANVKVVEPKLQVMDANLKFISIKNASTNEINLYGFEVDANGNSFVFPLDTIIMPGKISLFPSKITNLSPTNASEVSIKNKYGNLDLYEEVPVANPDLSVQKVAKIKNKTIAPNIGTTATPSNEVEKLSVRQDNTATVISAFNNRKVSSTTPTTLNHNWLLSLKHFFFGK